MPCQTCTPLLTSHSHACSACLESDLACYYALQAAGQMRVHPSAVLTLTCMGRLCEYRLHTAGCWTDAVPNVHYAADVTITCIRCLS